MGQGLEASLLSGQGSIHHRPLLGTAARPQPATVDTRWKTGRKLFLVEDHVAAVCLRATFLRLGWMAKCIGGTISWDVLAFPPASGPIYHCGALSFSLLS